jgi:hypothetical protein
MENSMNFKILRSELSFRTKNIIRFVNVETNPRLQ